MTMRLTVPVTVSMTREKQSRDTEAVIPSEKITRYGAVIPLALRSAEGSAARNPSCARIKETLRAEHAQK